MKRVVLYDPSVSSLNLGDQIIVEAAYEHLQPVLKGAFEVRVSTHLPVSLRFSPLLRNADAKFVLGTNLLMGRSRRGFRQWDVNAINARWLGPTVLMGVGWWKYGSRTSPYTAHLYRSILDPNALHSVRDDYTASLLREIGIKNVVNTGCPTMWNLTPEHCHSIPTKKASSVVTTVTDYHKDPSNDRSMLQMLAEVYDHVSVWPQGYFDGDYLNQVTQGIHRVSVLDPSLAAYNQALSSDVDYVGTRLHAGIRALQLGRRSIILQVDNRAAEMAKNFGIVTIPRGHNSTLRSKIESDFATELNIPWERISLWKSSNGVAEL